MTTVYTVTTAYNGDSPDGAAEADVRVFAELPPARACYEQTRQQLGLWSTEEPHGAAPDVYPDHGWILAYAAPGEDVQAFDEADAVGVALRAHPLLPADPCPRCGGDHDRIDRREPCPTT
jgi:hypothetical protein